MAARNRKTILVVDDDEDFLESLLLLLTREGHRAFPASGGHDAVLRYADLEPDIVFLDMKMPNMDGYEAFLKIKKHDRNARVVFTSSYILDDATYKHARAKGLAAIANKPIDLRTIRRMIREHAKR